MSDTQTTPAPAPLHPDITRLMARQGYYLSPEEPRDVQRAMAQLEQEDRCWAAHMAWRDALPDQEVV